MRISQHRLGSALDHAESEQQSGVIVPEFSSPLNDHEMTDLRAVVDPRAPSDSYGRDIFLSLYSILSMNC
ncbi:hypothetical protein XENORESO_011248 [Xenotaenia resolanae]|uniref:Uncharacterized protein n=1 Tax=Xenotaenia resolanae TaxID=208358 RepID=A0ABV0X3P3_9TELE